MSRPHAFTVNYREREASSRTLLDRGFFVHNLPRLIPLCRLLGHRPVVGGVGDLRDPLERRGLVSRWVVCDRCGVRPEPQGRLDPELYDDEGAPYDGPWRGPAVSPGVLRVLGDTHHEPGPWPASPRGEVGGQLVLGRTFGAFSVQVEVGCGGSEHTVAAHVRIWPLGGLYLHTKGFGEWLVRRLNPRDLHPRVIELDAHDGRLRWKLWAKQDEWSRTDPRWQQGSVRVDPRDILLGECRYSYVNHGGPVTATVRMPHGDDHDVTLQLQWESRSRPKSRRARGRWIVQWSSRPGIPTKPSGGEVTSAAVEVSSDAVRADAWPSGAAAAIAAKLTKDRTRYGYRPAAGAA